jgi:hypothetical protein
MEHKEEAHHVQLEPK